MDKIFQFQYSFLRLPKQFSFVAYHRLLSLIRSETNFSSKTLICSVVENCERVLQKAGLQSAHWTDGQRTIGTITLTSID